MLNFEKNVFVKVIKTHLSGASGAGARGVCFLNFYEDMFLEVQNKTYSPKNQ